MRSTALTLLLVAGTLGGCDYIGNPLEDIDTSGPGVGVQRRVLIEDLTGHTCPNCPSAAQTALSIQSLYGEDRVIIVGEHVTDAFAAPVPPLGDGEFDTDFRTEAGDEYVTQFGVTFLPAGLISRKEYGGSLVIGDGNWSSAVADIIDEPADLDVWFEDFAFNDATDLVTVTVKVAVLNELSGDHNLTIYLTEDHVIDDQIDNTATPPQIPDYDHRHVLRDNVNGTWGETAILGSAAIGDTLSFPQSYTLSSNVLQSANCALVAYVYNVASYEVLQAAERKFTP